MDYGRTQLAEKLAAEYALGTLRGPARRRFERLLPAHPALADALRRWEQRLLSLATPVAPVEPPPQLWQAIQRRLFGEPTPAPRWWQGLTLWRSLSGATAAMALAMLVMVSQPTPVQAPLVIVMQSTAEGVGMLKTGFVASVTADGKALVLKPIGEVQLDAGRALELWAVPAAGAPRSLGLVAGNQATTVIRANLLLDTSAFALSLEPSGGSPSGKPTGPIVSVGSI